MGDTRTQFMSRDKILKPIIAIPCRRCERVSDPEPIDRRNCYVLQTYVDAVAAAGGVPVLFPVVEDLDVSTFPFDGVLLTGGGDVQPSIYKGVEEKCIGTDKGVDDLDTEFIHYAMNHKKPIMGICRGLEILNVVLGGTLILKVDNNGRYHDRHDLDRTTVVHHLLPVKGSWLAHLLNGKTTIPSNSLHHQGCEVVAPSLTVVAVADDDPQKIPEVVESTERVKLRNPIAHIEDFPRIFAVQSHPEELWKTIPDWKLVFEAFVEASRARKFEEPASLA